MKPTPTPSGQGSNCVHWFKPSNLDCATIASSFGFFSEALFITWNPSVGLTCKNIRADSWYCIGIPTTGSTRTTPLMPQAPPTTDTSASFPTQTGVASGCQKRWFVSKGDTCDRITYIHDLTMADFLAMNPSVSTVTNQCGNLVPYVYVCVAVGGVPTTSALPSSSVVPSSVVSSSIVPSSVVPSSVAPSSSIAPAFGTPAPVQVCSISSLTLDVVSRQSRLTSSPSQQAGMAAGCHRFYLAQSGDGCWAISDAVGINLTYVAIYCSLKHESRVLIVSAYLVATSTIGTRV